MNEQDLREMVRESIARHSGDTVRLKTDTTSATTQAPAAFDRLPLVRSGDEEGNCLIEPAVRCNHCGYCQSYGH